LALLAADPAAPLRAPELGDPFLAGYDFEARSPAQVERTFGKSFAQAVFRLEPGAWRGPVESSYGQHLVRVHQRRGSRLPSLEEVRLEVRRDWIAEGRTKAKDALYERLRGKYSVVVDEPAARQGVEQVAASATAGGP
jgi:parvulin-like peptidyl-prolyl isomerase